MRALRPSPGRRGGPGCRLRTQVKPVGVHDPGTAWTKSEFPETRRELGNRSAAAGKYLSFQWTIAPWPRFENCRISDTGVGVGSSAARPRVLLADDEVLVRDLVQEALEEAGFEVFPVSSGAEAFEALEAQTDLIGLMTDINFGEPPSGWEVAVRAREMQPTLAVLYMTGDSAHEWSAHGAPQSTVVTKPFAPAQIAVGLATLLNRSDGSSAL